MKVKKILSTFLAMAMVISMLQGIALPAKASTDVDYIITDTTGDLYDVNSGGHEYSLSQALAACTDEGSDGVLTIQLGDGISPLSLYEALTTTATLPQFPPTLIPTLLESSALLDALTVPPVIVRVPVEL